MKPVNDLNPLGIIKLDHLEFTTESLRGKLSQIFYNLGCKVTFEDKKNMSQLFSHQDVNFCLNANPDPASQARRYYAKHGDGVCKISFRVENAELALERASKNKAQVVQDLKVEEGPNGELFRSGAIQGLGDLVNEFVERPESLFRSHFGAVAKDPQQKLLKVGVSRIDHFTNNVPKGEMDYWVEFYKRIYGMKETRYFDIKGVKTGLLSKVVQLANGEVIIPINEPEEAKGKSQIQEFLDVHKGSGVQHIALSTPNIVTTLDDLIDRGMKFLQVPSTYYEDIPKRKLPVEEKLSELEKRQILVDGDEKGYLLQIFSDPCIGPSFFEIIQRKNHFGFGEGNFQALFDAIERDQMLRGYLK